ncbi:proton-conducting transporter transmembrane domain-containing protein [Rubripirellula reticaptiva]|uniref:Probable inorganic carbon transporter subunit DabB n=1 Tax=Rubripirellula reticaptiva TaxID=2528013 RepID=A0A5C6F5H0_9BACT|nr:proton-conducting transporter membrane subunit [Rubripirellula reticaptiva]TWU55336.1 NADH-quinone oxidoreductase subunit L [Rubripirellula reticaptiva]
MSDAFPIFLCLPAAILVALVSLPNNWVNSRVRGFRRIVTLITGLQFAIAGGFAIAHVAGWVPVIHSVLVSVSGEPPIAASVHYDGVASLMLALVSFVGWVICQYSIRYLDGEPTQGRYFRWTAFTIGSVSLMVISGNLLMFVVAWVMTSLGLHQLLMHYGHRPAAKRAAWTKFTISRFGDAALIGAIAIIYHEFKTLDFAELFAAAGSLATVTPAMQVASFLLVAGAVTKSAQFPFHTWLPQTMETPTPVSALMHAGIVNAGGYLMIRTSPLVSLTPWALTTLAIIGGFTACFAAVVMLTQTSVKKTLAYSTIAQMGFMMLQCGLGAFSAAMLHILAHSLYKAHAFLSSGSVIAERGSTVGAPAVRHSVSGIKLAIAGIVIVTLLGLSFTLFGIDPLTKPGGLLLGGVLCLALTHWVGQVMRSGDHRLLIRAVTIAGVLCAIYSASFLAVDKVVATSLPVSSAPELVWLVAAVVMAGFVGMFGLHAALTTGRGLAGLGKWHVHASNGFYIESTLRRVFGPLLNT